MSKKIRMFFNIRILVRESGTEPVIRVMVEAETQELCEDYVNFILAAIRAKGHAN